MYKPLDELINKISEFDIKVKRENLLKETILLKMSDFFLQSRLEALHKLIISNLVELTGKDEKMLQLEYEKLLYTVLVEKSSEFLGKNGVLRG